jgi:hypothetical protein
MWTTAFARARRWARRTRRCSSRTRALENWLPTLWHCSARRPVGRRARSRAGRSQIHRSGSSLGNDQATRRRRTGSRLSRTRRSARTQADWLSWCGNARTRRGGCSTCRGRGSFSLQLGRNFHFRGFGLRQRHFSFVQNRYLVFNQRFRRPRRLNRGWCLGLQRDPRRRWLGRRNNRRRRTNHSLRCYETRRRFRRFEGDYESGTRGWCRRLHNRRRLPWRRDSGGRRNCLSRYRRNSLARKRGRTRDRGALHGPLLDKLPHVARLGDMRQVDLGLELIRRRGRCARAAAAAGLCMLRKVSLHALRLIYFDGAGVRFLLGYADLNQSIENGLTLYLELPRQIINSNLLHAALFPPYCPVGLRLHSVLTVKICRSAAPAMDLYTSISVPPAVPRREYFRSPSPGARA